jgi:hypothetical protein
VRDAGIPVQIAVRAADGTVLLVTKTSESGIATVHLCWDVTNPPRQVEATIELGAGRFVGAIVSFRNVSNRYCIILPDVVASDCGEWGTGPPEK